MREPRQWREATTPARDIVEEQEARMGHEALVRFMRVVFLGMEDERQAAMLLWVRRVSTRKAADHLGWTHDRLRSAAKRARARLKNAAQDPLSTRLFGSSVVRLRHTLQRLYRSAGG